MSRIISNMKHRRIESRNAREWQRMIASVGSPAMRDETHRDQPAFDERARTMTRLAQAARRRRARREAYRNSVHYAIAHAMSDSERNDLITLASEQGVLL